MLVRRIARPMLASIFVVMGADAVRDPSGRAVAVTGFAQQYGSMLPAPARQVLESDPENVVRANGLVHAGGGLMLATGRCPRTAASVLTASLLPTTLAGHAFWDETDPDQRKAQMVQFLKNLGLAGGLLLAAVDTEGRPSLGWRGRRAAREAARGVQSGIAALAPAADRSGPAADAAQAALDRGSALAGTVGRRGSELADAAAQRGSELADVAAQRGSGLADAAAQRGSEAAGRAGRRGARLADAASHRGAELAHAVSHRGAELADVAGRRGSELADAAAHRGAELADAAGERGAELLARAQAEAPALARRARRGARARARRSSQAVEHALQAARQKAPLD